MVHPPCRTGSESAISPKSPRRELDSLIVTFIYVYKWVPRKISVSVFLLFKFHTTCVIFNKPKLFQQSGNPEGEEA
jgi:hypothetical protein